MMYLSLTGLLSFMLETSPTLGSIETSDFGKRQLAQRSHEFNLKNATFKELFPDIAAKSKQIIENGAKPNSESKKAPSTTSTSNVRGDDAGFGLQNAVTNVLVIGGFAAFAFIVQYVLQSIN